MFLWWGVHFYPRSPYGERRVTVLGVQHRTGHFYPRSPYGERPEYVPAYGVQVVFLSTLSLRRATSSVLILSSPYIFLSTLSLRRATSGLTAMWCRALNFYPRSPYGERPISAKTASRAFYFYPRSPYGERRIILRNRISLSADFYPRSPYGERRSRSFLSMSKVWISIHALLTESDREWRGHQRQW